MFIDLSLQLCNRTSEEKNLVLQSNDEFMDV